MNINLCLPPKFCQGLFKIVFLVISAIGSRLLGFKNCTLSHINEIYSVFLYLVLVLANTFLLYVGCLLYCIKTCKWFTYFITFIWTFIYLAEWLSTSQGGLCCMMLVTLMSHSMKIKLLLCCVMSLILLYTEHLLQEI